MISCTLEQIGDRVALVLDPEDAQALNVSVGETVRLEVAGDGVLRVAQLEVETWTEDPHARGRAFLKRYTRTIAQLG